MRHFLPFPCLALTVLGCSAPPGAGSSHLLEMQSSGGTVYVVEAHEDWPDNDRDLTQAFEGGGQTRLMGEQALSIVLQALERGRMARLTHSTHFGLREGEPQRLSVGEFDLAVTPVRLEENDSVWLDYSLKRDRSGGPAVEIDARTLKLPLGATLLFRQARDGQRCTVVLFHVASVAEANEGVFEACMRRLQEEPLDVKARSLLPALLRVCDYETMDSMRRHHGTGEAIMRHNYRSHLWIHPFLRGCRLAAAGHDSAAEVEFEAALAVAMKGEPSRLSTVVAQESHLRLEEIQGRR